MLSDALSLSMRLTGRITRQCSGPSRRVSFLWFESRRGAGSATDRHYVMLRSTELAKAYFESDIFRPDSHRLAEVKAAILNAGKWEERFEWRISTERISRIEPAEISGHRVFRVTVECDFELQCHCPTLERAIQFERIYSQLISDMFYNFGWAGSAAKDRRNPIEGETAAT